MTGRRRRRPGAAAAVLSGFTQALTTWRCDFDTVAVTGAADPGARDPVTLKTGLENRMEPWSTGTVAPER